MTMPKRSNITRPKKEDFENVEGIKSSMSEMHHNVKSDDASCVHSGHKECTPFDCWKNCQCSICRDNRRHFADHGQVLDNHYIIKNDEEK